MRLLIGIVGENEIEADKERRPIFKYDKDRFQERDIEIGHETRGCDGTSLTHLLRPMCVNLLQQQMQPRVTLGRGTAGNPAGIESIQTSYWQSH